MSTSTLLKLHKDLIDHSSITGNEANVTEFLVRYLKHKNFTVETQTVTEGRENILAYVGQTRKTRVLLSSHLDVVPPFIPYERRGDKIYGRGSVDAKGCIATQIIAVENLLSENAIGEGDIGLLFVVGEETGGDGMRAANGLDLSWDAVIFGEPTELKLITGTKGFLLFTIKAQGKAGHSGYPELGTNANSLLVSALSTLSKLELPSSKKYGKSDLNIGRIEGGVAANVIAEEAHASLSVRVAIPDVGEIKRIISDALKDLSPAITVEFGFSAVPVDLNYDVDGFETMPVNYGTDIPHLNGAHRKYLYGPGTILVAHSDDEHLTVSDLETAVRGYKSLTMANLKPDKYGK